MIISEVCEKCDVSQDTLRYYENLCPLGGQAGIRVYAPTDLGVALPW